MPSYQHLYTKFSNERAIPANLSIAMNSELLCSLRYQQNLLPLLYWCQQQNVNVCLHVASTDNGVDLMLAHYIQKLELLFDMEITSVVASQDEHLLQLSKSVNETIYIGSCDTGSKYGVKMLRFNHMSRNDQHQLVQHLGLDTFFKKELVARKIEKANLFRDQLICFYFQSYSRGFNAEIIALQAAINTHPAIKQLGILSQGLTELVNENLKNHKTIFSDDFMSEVKFLANKLAERIAHGLVYGITDADAYFNEIGQIVKNYLATIDVNRGIITIAQIQKFLPEDIMRRILSFQLADTSTSEIILPDIMSFDFDGTLLQEDWISAELLPLIYFCKCHDIQPVITTSRCYWGAIRNMMNPESFNNHAVDVGRNSIASVISYIEKVFDLKVPVFTYVAPFLEKPGHYGSYYKEYHKKFEHDVVKMSKKARYLIEFISIKADKINEIRQTPIQKLVAEIFLKGNVKKHLFQHLRKVFPGKRILHIDDDPRVAAEANTLSDPLFQVRLYSLQNVFFKQVLSAELGLDNFITKQLHDKSSNTMRDAILAICHIEAWSNDPQLESILQRVASFDYSVLADNFLDGLDAILSMDGEFYDVLDKKLFPLYKRFSILYDNSLIFQESQMTWYFKYAAQAIKQALLGVSDPDFRCEVIDVLKMNLDESLWQPLGLLSDSEPVRRLA